MTFLLQIDHASNCQRASCQGRACWCRYLGSVRVNLRGVFGASLNVPTERGVVLNSHVPQVVDVYIYMITVFPLLATSCLRERCIVDYNMDNSPFLVRRVNGIHGIRYRLRFTTAIFRRRSVLHRVRISPIFPQDQVKIARNMHSAVFLYVTITFSPFIGLPAIFFYLRIRLLRFIFDQSVGR